MLAVLALLVPAHAVPLTLQHSGRVTDASGQPLDGQQDVAFSLYDAAAGGAALWTETLTVSFSNGYYSAILGKTEPIDVDDLDGTLYVALAVGQDPELPRMEISATPFALHARVAHELTTPTLGALDCLDGDIPTFDGRDWVCVEADAVVTAAAETGGYVTDDDLADVAYTGAYASLSGRPALATVATSGAYTDLSNKPSYATVATSGSYNDLTNKPTYANVATSGSYTDLTNRPALATVATTGAYADLTGRPTLAPVATSGAYADLTGKPTYATVATTGSYGDLTGRPSLATVATTGQYADLSGRPGLAAVATSGQYADLTGRPDLAVVATTGSWADLDDAQDLLTTDGGTLTGALEGTTAGFASWVRVGGTTGACATGLAGAVRFNGTAFEGCDGKDWLVLSRNGELGRGTFASCKAIRQASAGTLPNGRYLIDPDGAGTGVPFTVECDMETDGGGWTRVVKADYKFDACPGTLQKHSADWGCWRNISPSGVRTATFSTLGVSWNEARGTVTAAAVGSMEAFNATPASGSATVRYVDGMGIFTSGGTHVFTYALATWPQCPDCSCPGDANGPAAAPAWLGGHYECAPWPVHEGYRWYPLFHDRPFQRTLPNTTTDNLVISLQSDQDTTNEDFGLRKIELWVR